MEYLCITMAKIFDLEELQQVAQAFIAEWSGYRVFAFHGEMGAGKTTFITAVCGVLGVQEKVNSPTFSIINQYLSDRGSIYHMDLYRLKDEQEALDAGVEECLFSGEYCFVEWPTKTPDLFPAETVHVYIERDGNNNRSLNIQQPHKKL